MQTAHVQHQDIEMPFHHKKKKTTPNQTKTFMAEFYLGKDDFE